MATSSANGGESTARSGAQTLYLLAAALSAPILQALRDGPAPQADLRRAAGSPAQTTLRVHLKRLIDAGVIEKHRRHHFPGAIDYELSASGYELIAVVDSLERWLDQAPSGALNLSANPGRAAVRSLADSWTTMMLRVLGARARSLTELDSVISSLSYPSLERRLAALRLAGQVERCANSGSGTPYAVTPWLRSAVAPVLTAIRWERTHLPESTRSPSRIDIEAILLLALPLLRLPADLGGVCRLGVETPTAEGGLAGVVASVEGGVIRSCRSRLSGDADAWALGSLASWLGMLIDNDRGPLEVGGDGALAHALLAGLHNELFRIPREKDKTT